MPRKLTAAEHLESYLADVAARKVESGARRRISYGDGLYLFITGRNRADLEPLRSDFDEPRRCQPWTSRLNTLQ
jgi:hypothetical protein